MSVAESNPLERTLQNWVQQARWGVGAPDIGAAFDWIGQQQPDGSSPGAKPTSPTPGAAGYEDWEAVLRSNNAENDELCSENGRLRAEIERLRTEERNSAEVEDAAAQQADSTEAFEQDLLTSILEALDGVLDTWPSVIPTSICTAVTGDNKNRAARPDAHLGEDSETTVTDLQASAAAPNDMTAAVNTRARLIKERVEAATRDALQEEAAKSTPAPALTAGEETAVLVGERVALRELVERQGEKIRALEAELCESESAQASGLLGNALSMYAQGISDAHDALQTGVKELVKSTTDGKKGAATIGTEYEVIGRRGTIVRNGESLRSEAVGDLPPGSRVRVVGLSEKYHRRVEIICIRNAGASAAVVSPQAKPADTEGTVGEGAGEDNDGDSSSLSGAEPSPMSLITGWISACDKEGRMLIRAAPKPMEADGAVGSDAELDEEEGDVEIVDVTLSQDEWQALHQDSEASTRKMEALNTKMTKMSYQLLQSFEMKSVFSQLLQAVERAQDRCNRMGEASAMASEELEQRRFEMVDAIRQDDEASATPVAQPTSSTPASPSAARLQNAQGDEKSPVGDRLQAFGQVDWDRIMTERETTAAALSTGIQRVDVLEREVKEMDAEREILDSRDSKDIGGLRGQLRKTVTAMSKVFAAASSSTTGAETAEALEDIRNAAAAEGLFKRRVEDLQANVADLQADIARIISNERALKRSIGERRTTLRGLLHQGATADLLSAQCGPLQMTTSANAERRALQIAVEEQLSCNLSLCNSYGLQHRRPLEMLSKVPRHR